MLTNHLLRRVLCSTSFALAFAATTLTAQGGELYSLTSDDPLLRRIDPLTGATLTSVAVQVNGAQIILTTGLAVHPQTGIWYAIVRLSGTQGTRTLISIDPKTALGTLIGTTADRFASIAFDAAGILYGVTGDGAMTPETLYAIDPLTGGTGVIMALGNGSDGEALCFNPTDGLLYHWSGRGVQNTDEIFETVDPVTMTVTNIPLSGFDYNGTVGAMHYSGGNFIFCDGNNDLMAISTGGVVSLIGSTDHKAKGMAMLAKVPTSYYSEVYGTGCASASGNIPLLAASGAPRPSQTFTLGIENAPGGSLGAVFLGANNVSAPLSPTCSIHIMPMVGIGLPVTLSGTTGNPGTGAGSVALSIPAGVAGMFYFQAGVLDGAALALTNALAVKVQ